MTAEIAAALIDPRLKPGADLLAEGRAMARDWRLGSCLFLTETGMPSEAAWKRKAAAEKRVMQHAHIGFRSVDRTIAAIAEVHGQCREAGVTVDRFGITLDWSMGYPQAMRAKAARGTGIVLTSPEDFARITNAAPAAAHFGDFMLGLPGALENTRSAIAAGATAVGNLGQYFTFRLPYWDDDVATTEATVTALGLIAAQDTEILVHSNLDDGFAGLFIDMACALGMVLIEKHIVEKLIGARLAHCYGHHFSDPLSRTAFHAALVRVNDTPGTMIFGNTVSYQSTPAGNYASLASYLLADILAVGRWPSGHAINPVPVTENQRIPDVDEIIDAQTFAHRLTLHAPFYDPVFDWTKAEAMADVLVEGGRRFADAVMKGLAEWGVDTGDPAALMLAIRRMGPKRLEDLFGPGAASGRGRTPLIHAEWARELNHKAASWVSTQTPLASREPLIVCIGTTDVHEHGKYLVEQALAGLGVTITDAGVAVDPEALVAHAAQTGASAIAVSTYNGVALRYALAVKAAMVARGLVLPVLIGGRLNEVPKDSNSGLPVDVTEDIAKLGCVPCADLDAMLVALRSIPNGR
ncbi:cobalamin B12-binding domain-containing protein [Mesorhizobium sp. CO1-1-8]|uniref:cobalamin B12-binding domain-containing protein n=1 Tax=Mesorhizobium sp. CO1-1-8 TaxID=2876631 RepID=UPI001CD16BBB|nr:cobalamin B12-binding domain-containing protein [Mesorhizobium sp. CO1-1-8]MBZ9772875.1 cobalamin B12-binding domain-containing protein [Mesorhizobium sp. CO1-1-8]